MHTGRYVSSPPGLASRCGLAVGRSAGVFHFGNVYLSVSTIPASDYDIRIKPASPSWLSALGFPAFINNKPRHLPTLAHVPAAATLYVYVCAHPRARSRTTPLAHASLVPPHVHIYIYVCVRARTRLYYICIRARLCIRVYEGACISEAVERGANT